MSRGAAHGRRRRGDRRRIAQQALAQLSELVTDRGTAVSEQVVARHLMATARRHRQPLPEALRPWICRGCHSLLRPGSNARVRIRDAARVTTCLTCGRTRRWGPVTAPHHEEGRA